MVKRQDESIFIDFEYADGVIPKGFVAICHIVGDDGVGLAKNLPKSVDGKAFELRIRSGELFGLKAGKYKIEVAVVNDSIGYKDYIYNEDLIIRSE